MARGKWMFAAVAIAALAVALAAEAKDPKRNPGVCVAGAHPCKSSAASMCFDLCQALEVSFDKPTVKKAKLTMEGRVIGLLRSHCKGGGSATYNNVCPTNWTGRIVIKLAPVAGCTIPPGTYNSANGPFGLIIVENGVESRHSFWSDGEDEQPVAFSRLLEKLRQYPDYRLFHFGDYEPRVRYLLASYLRSLPIPGRVKREHARHGTAGCGPRLQFEVGRGNC